MSTMPKKPMNPPSALNSVPMSPEMRRKLKGMTQRASRWALFSILTFTLNLIAGPLVGISGLAQAATVSFSVNIPANQNVNFRFDSSCGIANTDPRHYELYTLTVDATGAYSYSDFGNSVDLHVAVFPFGGFSLTNPTQNCLKSMDDGGSVNLTAGQKYTVFVTSYSANVTGPGQFSLGGSGTATLSRSGHLIGSVFNDNGEGGGTAANGLQDGAEPSTNTGRMLNVAVLDNSGQVVSVSGVAPDGSVAAAAGSGSGYTAYLTTDSPAVGSTVASPIAKLPSGFASSGENVGGTVDEAGDSVLTALDASTNQAVGFGLSQSSVTAASCTAPVYANYGRNSDPAHPETIEYDNIITGFHQTAALQADGSWLLWGENMASDGGDVLTPQALNSANYPLLAGTPLKVAIGGINGNFESQIIALTTHGLYAWGAEGTVLDNALTSSKAMQRLVIGTSPYGLPPEVAPTQVKMLFATLNTLAITTCGGDVWVLSQIPQIRGNGSTGDSVTWSRVEVPGAYLTGIIATRGSPLALVALASDGSVFTWGSYTYLGDGLGGKTSRTRASLMTLPTGLSAKMIGALSDRYDWTWRIQI